MLYFNDITEGSCTSCLSKGYNNEVLKDDNYYIVIDNYNDIDSYVSLATEIIVPEIPGFQVMSLISVFAILILFSRKS